MDNLKDFLMASVLIEEPNKLEMDLKSLLEKSPFMVLVKEGTTKSEEGK